MYLQFYSWSRTPQVNDFLTEKKFIGSLIQNTNIMEDKKTLRTLSEEELIKVTDFVAKNSTFEKLNSLKEKINAQIKEQESSVRRNRSC